VYNNSTETKKEEVCTLLGCDNEDFSYAINNVRYVHMFQRICVILDIIHFYKIYNYTYSILSVVTDKNIQISGIDPSDKKELQEWAKGTVDVFIDTEEDNFFEYTWDDLTYSGLFIGEYCKVEEEMINEAKAEIDQYEDKKIRNKNNKLKQLIRHNVPLINRINILNDLYV
jgi:hypothetical protein